MTKKLLKNKLTIALSLMFFSALVPMQSIAQKKIAYMTLSTKVMGAGASTIENDAIIRMFQADSRFAITVVKDDGKGSSAVNLSQYDLVIIQETFNSGDAVLKPTGLLAIKNLTIPVIYNKAYSLRGARAITTSASSAADVTDLAITVPLANQSNPLFTGITFSGESMAIFNAQAADNGTTTGTLKSLQYVKDLELTNAGTCKGFVAGVTSADTSVVINDIPGGTSFGTGGSDILPLTSRMITFTMNYGAIAAGDGTNLTANGLKLWQNAALILTGQALGVNENTLASDSVSVSPNPTSGLVTVNSASAVKAVTVYDATGKQVSASNTNTVDLSNQAKGIYLVQVQTESGSTTKKIVVE